MPSFLGRVFGKRNTRNKQNNKTNWAPMFNRQKKLHNLKTKRDMLEDLRQEKIELEDTLFDIEKEIEALEKDVTNLEKYEGGAKTRRNRKH